MDLIKVHSWLWWVSVIGDVWTSALGFFFVAKSWSQQLVLVATFWTDLSNVNFWTPFVRCTLTHSQPTTVHIITLKKSGHPPTNPVSNHSVACCFCIRSSIPRKSSPLQVTQYFCGLCEIRHPPKTSSGVSVYGSGGGSVCVVVVCVCVCVCVVETDNANLC